MNRLLCLLLYARLWQALFFPLMAAVLYLTLKPNPQIAEVALMPRPMSQLFDLHDDWKNIVGFGTLALAGFLGWPLGWGPYSWSSRSRRRLLGIALFSVVWWMEFCQLFIPTRFTDIKDIFAGSLGVMLAWALAKAAVFLDQARFNPLENNKS